MKNYAMKKEPTETGPCKGHGLPGYTA